MKALLIIAAAAMAIVTAPVASAAQKPMHHHVHKAMHHGKACKGEFMYMKGGKCQDARNKA